MASRLQALGNDVWVSIFEFCKDYEIHSCTSTCKFFKALRGNAVLTKRIRQRRITQLSSAAVYSREYRLAELQRTAITAMINTIHQPRSSTDSNRLYYWKPLLRNAALRCRYGKTFALQVLIAAYIRAGVWSYDIYFYSTRSTPGFSTGPIRDAIQERKLTIVGERRQRGQAAILVEDENKRQLHIQWKHYPKENALRTDDWTDKIVLLDDYSDEWSHIDVTLLQSLCHVAIATIPDTVTPPAGFVKLETETTDTQETPLPPWNPSKKMRNLATEYAAEVLRAIQ